MKQTAFAEAPSKTILTGEHFVVHGSRALAAAVGRKTSAEVSASDKLEIVSSALAKGDQRASKPLRLVAEAVCKEYGVKPRFRIRISSAIPHGAGMGSSASTAVAVASALGAFHRMKMDLDDIIRFAMEGEKEVHGRPSGIDVNICARGGVILFRMGERPEEIRFEGLRTLLVVNSGLRRDTRTQINKVSTERDRHPAMFDGLAQSIDELSLMAAERLRSFDMAGLGRLFTLNHAVLSGVGVSNSALDELVETLLSMGCLGAKLTGGGGGGSVVAIPPPAKGKSIIGALAGRGFEGIEAKIPVPGVRSWLRQ